MGKFVLYDKNHLFVLFWILGEEYLIIVILLITSIFEPLYLFKNGPNFCHFSISKKNIKISF